MLGQDLVKVFEADQSWEVFAYDRDEIDIASEESLKEKIEEDEPMAVVNASGYNAVDRCEADEIEFELAKKINGYGPGLLAKLGKEKRIPIVHYSTDYVFDGEKGEYGENDKPAPISNYGRSKLLGEEEIQKNTDKYYLIRTSKLFGQSGKSLLSKRSFFDTMIQIAKDNSTIKVIDEERSCFTYTPDLALETKRLLKSVFRLAYIMLSTRFPALGMKQPLSFLKLPR